MATHPLAGVYVAALTPLNNDLSPNPNAITDLMTFYAGRGCHGALLLGTTGEGPSFAAHERVAVFRAAVRVREQHPNFKLFAGTGTPSLEESIALTRAAFDLGFDGAVVLPPYYFRQARLEGLERWFSILIEKAVPSDGALLGYHFPAVSGVPLKLELLKRLKDRFPAQFVGIKDSSGSPEHARQLGGQFGEDLLVFTGNDRLFSLALENHAGGCITAMAKPDRLKIRLNFHRKGK
jgi:4-hydroxy-tetrahydrodipicolinate synthase